jgi:hypothetical protein
MAFSFGKMNDTDATLFVQVSGITDTTQRGAIVDLVKDLKSNNLWSKMKAVYPMVGGTAETHKWNLKDPRDVDAAFRLTFTGGWTHSSTGAKGNGTNGYADTYLNPRTSLSTSNSHFCFYNRTSYVPSVQYMYFGGSYDITTSPVQFWAMNTYYQNSLYEILYGLGGNNFGFIQSSSLSVVGSLIQTVTGTSSDLQKFIRNGNILHTSTNNNGIHPNRTIYINALNYSQLGVFGYTNFECGFSSIGDGLTDTDASNLYTIVQKYQTTLGRQV